jgi:hypothetical protein
VKGRRLYAAVEETALASLRGEAPEAGPSNANGKPKKRKPRGPSLNFDEEDVDLSALPGKECSWARALEAEKD